VMELLGRNLVDPRAERAGALGRPVG
jgi:hypothetical protein